MVPADRNTKKVVFASEAGRNPKTFSPMYN